MAPVDRRAEMGLNIGMSDSNGCQYLEPHPESSYRQLFVKGRAPGVTWVATVTALVGVHGYLLALVIGWWLWRRNRRSQAILTGQTSEVEEEFFSTDTLD